jgi:hypothetical protein
MLAMVIAPLLYAVDALPLWALMVLMAVVGAADGPSTAVKSVFLPAATRAAHAPLERGTGLLTAAERTATAIGPALAGFLVAALGGCGLAAPGAAATRDRSTIPQWPLVLKERDGRPADDSEVEETSTGCHDLMVETWEAQAGASLPDDLEMRHSWFTPTAPD